MLRSVIATSIAVLLLPLVSATLVPAGTESLVPNATCLASGGAAVLPGCPEWVSAYDASGVDATTAVAVAPEGQLVFSLLRSEGEELAGGFRYDDILVRAHYPDTGALAWSRRYDGPGGKHDSPSSLLVDHSRVIVVGTSYNGFLGGDSARLLAYGLASGEFLWTHPHPGQPGWGATVASAALDLHQNLVVVAGTSSKFTDSSVEVAGFDAFDGTMLWNFSQVANTLQSTVVLGVATDGERAYVAASAPNWHPEQPAYIHVWALWLDTGQVAWFRSFGGNAQLFPSLPSPGIAVSGDLVAVAGMQLLGLEKATGDLVWSVGAPHVSGVTASAAGERFYWTSFNESLAMVGCVEADGALCWATTTFEHALGGGRPFHMVATSKYVALTGAFGLRNAPRPAYALLLDAATGDVTLRHRFESLEGSIGRSIAVTPDESRAIVGVTQNRIATSLGYVEDGSSLLALRTQHLDSTSVAAIK